MKSALSKPNDGAGFGIIWLGLLALLTALPLLAIFALALGKSSSGWPANIVQLVWNTAALCGGAGLIALIIGTVMAWLVSFHNFPGRRFLKWMALLPLALPGYIVSFVYVDALTFAGPLQQMLRDVFGWTRPGDYWFPDIRSTTGAAIIMGFALYPYVYLAGVAAFMRQPMNQLHVARTLGRKPLAAFLQIVLPQARAALIVGALLVVMECVNDIGAATFFGVSTLTTAVYTIWLDQGDLAGAAQLASLLILFMALLVYFETVAKSKTLRDGKNAGRLMRLEFKNWRGALAAIAMALPIVIGFLIPLILLISQGSRRFSEIFSAAIFTALEHSTFLAVMACIATLVIALYMSQFARGKDSKPIATILRLSSLGYALPGTVLGIGVLVPFGQFDQWLNRVAMMWTGLTPGLILSGGVFALIFAYATRFLIIAVSHVEDGLQKIPMNFDHVASTLGRKRPFIFRSIHLPLLKPSLISASLLVFVDAMKELPATLILRPFDFETLATLVFSLASLGQFESAAIPALLIVLTGLIPVIVLSRNLRTQT
jgi:iron(III) transport system permease protein